MKTTNEMFSAVYATKEEIQQRAKELAKQITEDYRGKNLLVISILKGAFFFSCDVISEIDLPIEIEFIRLKSYIASSRGMSSSGNVEITRHTPVDVKNKDVLIIEDMIDTGRSARAIKKFLEKGGAKSIEFCTMAHQPTNAGDCMAKYTAFYLPKPYISGYGPDYNEKYRNETMLGAIDPVKHNLDVDVNDTDTFDNLLKDRIETYKLTGKLVGYIDYEKTNGKLALKSISTDSSEDAEEIKKLLLEGAEKAAQKENLEIVSEI